MPKRLLHVLTLASAVICVGSLIWVGRSAFCADMIESTNVWNGGTGGAAATVDGQLLLFWASGSKPFEFDFDCDSESASGFRRGLDQIWTNVRGVRWLGIGCGTSGMGLNATIVILPLWLVPILTAILPVRWWRRRRLILQTRGFTVVETRAEQT